MKYKIRFLPDAKDDLKIIKQYLNQFYPGTTGRFIDLLKKHISRLKDFPLSCPVYEDDNDYRKLVVNEYLVFYMVNEKDHFIDVHHIFHGSRNIKQLL